MTPIEQLEAEQQAARKKQSGDQKVGNWTHGGSDTRDGGRVPQGSDTKELYRQPYRQKE